MAVTPRRISDLPAVTSPSSANRVPLDDGTAVRSASLPELMDSDAAKNSIAANAKNGLLDPFDTGLTRSIGEKLRDVIVARDVGAPEAAAAANTAGFAQIVAEVGMGVAVDLQGDVFPVAARPHDLTLFGGGVRLDGQIISAPAIRRPHPYSGRATVIADDPGSAWPVGVWPDPGNNNWWRAEIVGGEHGSYWGSRIDALLSYDTADTWFLRRTIFSDLDNSRIMHAGLGPMSDGRIGGIVATGDTTAIRLWTIWLNPVTGVFDRIDHGLHDAFLYGGLMPGPSGLPGDFMMGAYGANAASRGIKIVRTQDNGQTITVTTVAGTAGLPGSGAYPTEPCFAQVPGRGWACSVRVETSPPSGQNLQILTSADGLTYGPYADSGHMLGSNAAQTLFSGGKLHFSFIHRDGFHGSSRLNQQRVISAPADKILANPASLANYAEQPALSLAAKAIGYPASHLIPGTLDDWVHIAKVAEGAPASVFHTNRCMTVAVRDVPGEALGPQIKPEIKQLLDNWAFRAWDRGDSFSLSADGPIASRWEGVCHVSNTSNMLFDKIVLTNAQSRRFQHKPMNGLRVRSGGSPANYSGIRQTAWGSHAILLARAIQRGSDLTPRQQGLDEYPIKNRCFLQVRDTAWRNWSFGTMMPIASHSKASWHTECRMQPGSIPIPLSTVTAIRLTFENSDGNQELDYTLTACTAYPTALLAGLEWGDQEDVEAKVALYFRRWAGLNLRIGQGDYIGSNQAVVAIELAPAMMLTPTISVSNNSHFELVTGNTAYPVTAMSFSATASQIVATVTATGAPASGHCQLRIKDAAGWMRAETGF